MITNYKAISIYFGGKTLYWDYYSSQTNVHRLSVGISDNTNNNTNNKSNNNINVYLIMRPYNQDTSKRRSTNNI